MNTTELRNTFVNAVDATRFRVMLRKLWLRIGDERGSLSQKDNLRWVRANCTDFAAMAAQDSPLLWQEAQLWSEEMERHAETVLSGVPAGVGGGGVYPFLYFLTRWLEPRTVLETGVAAGYSSRAFLAALHRNGEGRLYSSDFPYFRLRDPEQYIGVLVEENLRENWELYVDGDQVNLPKIASRVKQIDLFHYDSDKSYSGRQFALSVVQPRLSPQSVVLIDDIQDNSFFHDYVRATDPADWSVFEFGGKYVGASWNGARSLT